MTHTGQENYKYYELTTDQWRGVLEKAKAAPEADLHLYILRSLANQQVVNSPASTLSRDASINAILQGRVVDTERRKIERLLPRSATFHVGFAMRFGNRQGGWQQCSVTNDLEPDHGQTP